MPQIKLSTRAQTDIFRLYKFLLGSDELSAKRAVTVIKASFNPLRRAPLIGRLVEENLTLRELVIPFGSSGYIALYRYDEYLDVVTILTIKHQKESDYK